MQYESCSFAIDVLQCDRCGGAMRLMATIHSPEATRKILDCLGLPSRPPPMAPAPCISACSLCVPGPCFLHAPVLISCVRGSSRSGGYHKQRSGDQRRLTRSHTPAYSDYRLPPLEDQPMKSPRCDFSRPRRRPASISNAKAAAFRAAISCEPDLSAWLLFSIKSEIPRTTPKHTCG